MPVDVPKQHRLHLLASSAVKELSAKWGVEPTRDELLWLHELAKRVTNPFGGATVGLSGCPVRMGRALLWPFTIGAGLWYSECALPMFEGDADGRATLALAYALAHSREPDTLHAMLDYDTASATLDAWALSIGVTAEELEDAIALCLRPEHAWAESRGDDDTPIQEGETIEVWASLIERMCSLYGEPPDFWRWQQDRSDVLRLLNNHAAAQAAKAGRKPHDTPSDRAFRAFRQAIAAIVADRGAARIDLDAKDES